MWKGDEPIRNEFNQTYLDTMSRIIDSAASYGIYTYLDMHQDDMSEKFCGEGLPDWAIQPQLASNSEDFPFPLDEPYTSMSVIDGFPTRQDCAKHDWPSYYNTKSVGSAFQSLYTGVDGLLEDWGIFWKKIAANVGSKDSVIGYELINEVQLKKLFHDEFLNVL